jgi:hypothetical protein
MSTTANHIPAYEMEQRSKRECELRERNSIWKRCTTLLETKENVEDHPSIDDSAVLGYN